MCTHTQPAHDPFESLDTACGRDATHRQNTHSTSEYTVAAVVVVFRTAAFLHDVSPLCSPIRLSLSLRSIVYFCPFWENKRHALRVSVLRYWGSTFDFIFHSVQCIHDAVCFSNADDNDYNTPEWIRLCSYQTIFGLSMQAFRFLTLKRCHVALMYVTAQKQHETRHLMQFDMLHVTTVQQLFQSDLRKVDGLCGGSSELNICFSIFRINPMNLTRFQLI